MNPDKNKHRTFFAAFMIILSIVLVSSLTYKDILDDYFSGIDTFTLIEGSQIHTLQDVFRILTERMNSGTSFKKTTRFYRPIASFSYSIDYLIWKLNPLGYHLTDLLLHIIASILVFLLIRSLTEGKPITAWIGAIIFTTHPILVEIVPANARRHDILFSIFIMLALLMFRKYSISKFKQHVFLIFSILFYLLALGSKEIAVIFPFLILFYLMIFVLNHKKSFWTVFVLALKKCVVYFAITFIFILWRSYVLQGIGGYAKRTIDKANFFQDILTNIKNYFLNLFVPPQSANSFFHPSRILLIISAIIIVFLVFSIIPRFLKNLKLDIKMHPNGTKKYISGRILLFSLLWLLLPLIIYLWARISHPRYMYTSIIPFSIILSLCLEEGLQLGFKAIKGEKPCFHFRTLIFIPAFYIAFSLVLDSPLLKHDTIWEKSGTMSAMFFQKLSMVVPDFPEDSTLIIHDLPSQAYIRQHSISSWLNLSFPGKDFKVTLKSMVKTSANPGQLYLKVKERGAKKFVIYCQVNKLPGDKLKQKV
jgi:hypothetical protein